VAYAGFLNGGPRRLENELQFYFYLVQSNNCRHLGEVFENVCKTSTYDIF